MKTLTDRLEALRDKWSNYARGIEITRGYEDPAAKAFRRCISEVYEAIKEQQQQDTQPTRGLKDEKEPL